MEDWRERENAQRWSADPLTHNPLRAEQLDILLAILESEYREHKTILDIGLGSGLVEEMIFKRIPHAYVIGVDFSRAMLDLAAERLRGFEGQYEVFVHDLKQAETLELPDEDYQIAISVQTIHNLPDEHKPGVFGAIYNALEPGGLFLLLDRIAIETPALFDCYKALWSRLDRLHGAHMREGSSYDEHTEKVAARGDLPATLEQNLRSLRDTGFQAACLHLHGNRALIAARKAE